MRDEQTDAYAAPDDWHSIDIVYDRTIRELEIQAKEWEEADNRLKLFLGFIGVVFAASLGVTGNLAAFQWIVRLFAIAAVVCLFMAAVAAGFSYRPQVFKRPPNVRTLRLRYLTSEEKVTKLAIVDQILTILGDNRKTIDEKIRGANISQLLFMGSIFFTALAIITRLLTEGGSK